MSEYEIRALDAATWDAFARSLRGTMALPEDGVPGWWPMVRGGWSDTVDRLATELSAPA